MPKCRICGKNYRTKALLGKHTCTPVDDKASEEESENESGQESVSPAQSRTTRRQKTKHRESTTEEDSSCASSTNRRRKKHRVESESRKKKRKSRKSSSSSNSSSSDSSSDSSDTSSDSGRSDISGGILDRQDDARRVIPRAWPAKRENLRAAIAEMRQTMQEKNPPIWVIKQMKMLQTLATHLHKDNKRSLKKKGRPHPAAECVFVQLMRSYLHTIHGENAEKKFEEELSKMKDTTSKTSLRRAIAKAKNASPGGKGKQDTGQPFRQKQWKRKGKPQAENSNKK
jgi:hypothetical protein